MEFELIPNEIILDLFEYLSINDLFDAFLDLNSRFNKLLYIEFQKFHLDLRSLSKIQFNRICQKYVPLIIDRIISIHLADDDNASHLIELFLSQNYQLRQFTCLRSISLSFIQSQSQQILDQILVECFHLPCLTHLAFYHTVIIMSIDNSNRFYNYIWSLPNLTHYRCNVWISRRNNFPNPKTISTSLKRFSIPMVSCNLSTLNHLYEHTPNLEYLSIKFYDHSTELLQLSSSILSIIKFKIHFCGSIHVLEHLLQSMPNLYHLTFETDYIYINGAQWEKIFRKYLFKLKIFQFKMRFPPINNKCKEIQLNEIIDTYQTKFWIDEHQWFVRCHWYSSDKHHKFDHINLFSLPYMFRKLPDDINYILAKSTWPYDNQSLTYDHVIDLCYTSSFFTNSIVSDIRLSNIQTLSISLPFNDHFLMVVTKLHRLTSLNVYIEKDEDLPGKIQLQLQSLLDRAPYLRSLSFGRWLHSDSYIPPMELTSISVCRLDLEEYVYNDNENHFFDNEQCVELSRSSLGKQCETLLIQVKNKRNIVNLVNNMSHLQLLKVHCEDDNLPTGNYWEPITNDELVQWLREQLPSSCMIMRELHFLKRICLWIR